MALGVAAGLAAGLTLGLSLPPRYRSTVSLAAEFVRAPAVFGTSAARDRLERRLPDLRRSLTGAQVLSEVLRETGGGPGPDLSGRDVARMADALSLEAIDGNILHLAYTDRDPARAAEVANRLAERLAASPRAERPEPPLPDGATLEEALSETRRQLDEMVSAIERLRAPGAEPKRSLADARALQRLEDEHRTLVEEHRLALARIAALRARPGPPAPPAAAPNPELTRLREELASLQARYTDQHPDMVATRRRIARLEAAEVPPPAVAQPRGAAEEEIRRAEDEIEALEDRRAQLEAQIAGMSVVPLPSDRDELSRLEQRHVELQERYASLERQKEAADRAEIEARTRPSASFHILEEARPAPRPDFPDRVLFAVVGALFGLVTAWVAVMVAEGRNPTVLDPADVDDILGCPLLAEIPLAREVGAAGPRQRAPAPPGPASRAGPSAGPQGEAEERGR